jgi:hypothetical protein
METPIGHLFLETPVDHLLHLATTARSRRGRRLAATFLLSLYDGRGVALYHLRMFPAPQRAWFLAALQAYLPDPSGWIRQHRSRLYQLQQGCALPVRADRF